MLVGGVEGSVMLVGGVKGSAQVKISFTTSAIWGYYVVVIITRRGISHSDKMVAYLIGRYSMILT